jgi:hypothetical protein
VIDESTSTLISDNSINANTMSALVAVIDVTGDGSTDSERAQIHNNHINFSGAAAAIGVRFDFTNSSQLVGGTFIGPGTGVAVKATANATDVSAIGYQVDSADDPWLDLGTANAALYFDRADPRGWVMEGGSVTFRIVANRTTDEPLFRIEQNSTGDASIRYRLVGSDSWATGIDNDVAGNPYRICAGASLGAGTCFDFDSSGNLTPVRLKTSGTAVVAGDIAISTTGAWGDTADAAVGSVSGNDQWFQWTITAGGANTGASPTIAITFTDGTWTTAPIVLCNRQDFNAPATVTVTVTTVTATAITLTFDGTPTATNLYKFACHVGGV